MTGRRRTRGREGLPERSAGTIPAAAESHGRELRSCSLDGLRIAEVSMPAGLDLGDHSHPTGQVVFVLEGRYREEWDRRRVRLAPGSVIYRPPGRSHANRFGTGGALTLVVSYGGDRLASLARRAEPIRMPALLDDLCAVVTLEMRRDGESTPVLEGLAMVLAARVDRFAATPGRPAWLDEALAFIGEHHAEPIGLASVSARVGVHRATLAACFRRFLGRSVGEVLQGSRVRRAVDELTASRRPLAEVALICGFCDQSHMGRVLRRRTGRTPGEIRRGGSPRAR